MKTISKLFVIAGAAVLMASCTDEPFKTNGQKYRDAFFETYGEVSPEQEWNMASEMSVTVDPVIHANRIEVYAQVGEKFYRVALYRDINEITTIPFDAPYSTDQLLVDIDGVRYLATPGQTVVNSRLCTNARRASRAERKVVKIVNEGHSEDWSCQFLIRPNGNNFSEGDQVEISFKVYAEEDWNVDAKINSGSSLPQLQARKDTWVPYTASFTSPNSDSQGVQLDMNCKNDGQTKANTYYFEDIQLKVNGTVVNHYYNLWNDGAGKGSIDENFDFNSLGGGSDPGNGGGSDPGNGGGNTGEGYIPTGRAIMVENYCAEGAADYQPQLQITGNFVFQASIVLEFDVYADEDWNLEAYLQSSENTNTAQVISKTIGVEGGKWIHFRSDAISVESTCDLININLNTAVDGHRIPNVYYFANIKVIDQSNGNELSAIPNVQNMGANHVYGSTITLPASSVGNPDAELAGNMRWLILAEDLGAIGDVDFNDVIFSIEFLSVNVNLKGNDWNVSENEYPMQGGTSEGPEGAPRLSRRDDGQVVLEMSRADDNKVTQYVEEGAIKLTALAAGGVFPVYLHYYNPDTQIDYLLTHRSAAANDPAHTQFAGEWHHWFVSDNSQCYDSKTEQFKMINTGHTKSGTLSHSGIVQSGVVPTAVLGHNFKMSQFSNVFVNSDYTTAEVVSGFYITVGENYTDGRTQHQINAGNNFSVVGVTEKGKAPQMFMIPDVGYGEEAELGWAWPKEQISITSVYPSFVNWYSDANRNEYWSLDKPLGNRAGQPTRYITRGSLWYISNPNGNGN